MLFTATVAAFLGDKVDEQKELLKKLVFSGGSAFTFVEGKVPLLSNGLGTPGFKFLCLVGQIISGGSKEGTVPLALGPRVQDVVFSGCLF